MLRHKKFYSAVIWRPIRALGSVTDAYHMECAVAALCWTSEPWQDAIYDRPTMNNSTAQSYFSNKSHGPCIAICNAMHNNDNANATLGHINKFVLYLLRRLSTSCCPHLLLSAGTCSTAPSAVDRYLTPAGRTAANPPAAVAAVDRCDRRTDGRTDGWTPDR